LGDPVAGQDPVRDRFRKLHPELTCQGQHAEQDPGAAAGDRGGKDHTVPHIVSTSTRRLYNRSPAITDFREFPDRGHSLTIDHGWRDVAQEVLDWLKQRSL
jgi:hypothetical protein